MGNNASSETDDVTRTPGTESATSQSAPVEPATYQEISNTSNPSSPPEPAVAREDRAAVTGGEEGANVRNGAHLRGRMNFEEPVVDSSSSVMSSSQLRDPRVSSRSEYDLQSRRYDDGFFTPEPGSVRSRTARYEIASSYSRPLESESDMYWTPRSTTPDDSRLGESRSALDRTARADTPSNNYQSGSVLYRTAASETPIYEHRQEETGSVLYRTARPAMSSNSSRLRERYTSLGGSEVYEAMDDSQQWNTQTMDRGDESVLHTTVKSHIDTPKYSLFSDPRRQDFSEDEETGRVLYRTAKHQDTPRSTSNSPPRVEYTVTNEKEGGRVLYRTAKTSSDTLKKEKFVEVCRVTFSSTEILIRKTTRGR